MLSGHCPRGRTGTVAETVSIMRRAHGWIASERVVSPSLTGHSPRVTVEIVTAVDLKTVRDAQTLSFCAGAARNTLAVVDRRHRSFERERRCIEGRTMG